MKKCRCCRQWWPIECYVRQRTARSGRTSRCYACRVNCGIHRRRRDVERTRAWKERVRSEVEAVRASRVA